MQKSWDGYITALGKQANPASTIDGGIPFPNTGGGFSGFKEYKPNNPEIQKRYDAMSPNWEGIEASNSAVNLFRAEFMPIQNGFIPKKNTNIKDA